MDIPPEILTETDVTLKRICDSQSKKLIDMRRLSVPKNCEGFELVFVVEYNRINFGLNQLRRDKFMKEMESVLSEHHFNALQDQPNPGLENVPGKRYFVEFEGELIDTLPGLASDAYYGLLDLAITDDVLGH